MDYLTIDMVIEHLRLVDPPPSIIKAIEEGITKSEKAVYEILNRSNLPKEHNREVWRLYYEGYKGNKRKYYLIGGHSFK